MDEPEQLTESTEKGTLNWHVPRETLEGMNPEQLRAFVIDMNERTSRLYDAIMAMAGESRATVRKKDVDLILNPDKQKYYYDIEHLGDTASGG
jgi:hypothetical protein